MQHFSQIALRVCTLVLFIITSGMQRREGERKGGRNGGREDHATLHATHVLYSTEHVNFARARACTT